MSVWLSLLSLVTSIKWPQTSIQISSICLLRLLSYTKCVPLPWSSFPQVIHLLSCHLYQDSVPIFFNYRETSTHHSPTYFIPSHVNSLITGQYNLRYHSSWAFDHSWYHSCWSVNYIIPQCWDYTSPTYFLSKSNLVFNPTSCPFPHSTHSIPYPQHPSPGYKIQE